MVKKAFCQRTSVFHGALRTRLVEFETFCNKAIHGRSNASPHKKKMHRQSILSSWQSTGSRAAAAKALGRRLRCRQALGLCAFLQPPPAMTTTTTTKTTIAKTTVTKTKKPPSKRTLQIKRVQVWPLQRAKSPGHSTPRPSNP